jgi:APA family basic amino acid/polyamine antiporter
MGAEEPSRIRGGARLGGRGGPLEGPVGDVTKYVVNKAPCRVIVTAPPARDHGGPERDPAREDDERPHQAGARIV